ncbi:hypothetical protein DCC85_14360 [Paenibacillus sp. CAA11]|uniref:hypothetical protein n=1 Tax=Paenibacillus sp. CAA11 TaxID=1532905 RepID=UPI000D3B14D4|nr:hypothetical protein [Paenibacillus sp. CAA11]AWB45292.1 hypothetical protein DCC85_14360 [Paenibacillus sp. CAA11]
MERRTYCRFCNEEHVVSETRDTLGNIVGLFCNREKAMVTSHTTAWNEEDIMPAIERFVDATVDRVALARIKTDKMSGLARKIGFQFIQTSYARERKINYAFAVHHILAEIRRMREHGFHSGVKYA